MEDISTILNELLEAAKNLVISIEDEDREETLTNFAKLSAVNGKLATLIIENE